VFNKFEEFDGGLPSSKEFEKLLSIALSASKKNKIRYFETIFGEDDDLTFCIRGIRCPTIKEANDFCKVDTLRFGKKITSVVEITENEAKAIYNFDKIQKSPIFGLDAPLTVEDVFNSYTFNVKDKAGRWTGKKIIVYASDYGIALSAVAETRSANPCLICKYNSFVAAIHGGLEPIN
jgi:hypothetical protein